MRKFMCSILMLCMMTGCSLITKFQEMPAKQRVLWFMRTFNAEYMDVCQAAQIYGLLSVEQQKIVRWKHKLLMEVYPLIKAYLMAIEAGNDVAVAEEDAITALLNRIMLADPADVDKNAPPDPNQKDPAIPPEESHNPA